MDNWRGPWGTKKYKNSKSQHILACDAKGSFAFQLGQWGHYFDAKAEFNPFWETIADESQL